MTFPAETHCCVFGCRTPVPSSGDACRACAPLLADDARCLCGDENVIRMHKGAPQCIGCANALLAQQVFAACPQCGSDVPCDGADPRCSLCLTADLERRNVEWFVGTFARKGAA